MVGVPWCPYPRDKQGGSPGVGQAETWDNLYIVIVGVPWCPYPRDTAVWESYGWLGYVSGVHSHGVTFPATL